MPEQDSILLNKIARGDRKAFRQLYDQHVRSVYAVALRVSGNYEDAEEATQDAFMQLMREGSRLMKIRNVRGWLMQVASRRAIDGLRRRAARPELKLGDMGTDGEVLPLDALASRAANARDEAGAAEFAAAIRRRMSDLPERQMMAFSLRHFESLSIKEIAQTMECSEGAVKAHLHFALTKMREWLAEDGFLKRAAKSPKEAEG